ncbi:protein of unknown function [Agrobacterium pusense]|uniref:Uncharacterized protein n=1 Tax=Agrobacterium pusense TaxID=648995 RepID=U4Q754_9HYPH|nr:protein of unknown function [Agrobacterium pusense]
MERRHVDNIVERASRGLERGREIFESKPNLTLKVGFGRSVGTAADLTGNEKKVTRPNCRGVTVLFVKRVPVCGKNCLAFAHLASLFLAEWRRKKNSGRPIHIRCVCEIVTYTTHVN